ncbi:GntR family transcriptional regulator [Virgibacillus siamensis]|uniref:GntR family transcriptional regulator n=1 Tax=Virgibacillus siamensis TaxID=480071 RepID=A0ABN1G065_9BACI
MAVSMSPKQKVYQGVLQEIRRYIDSNNLVPGDKLPSERDLSEKLQAGRSSVREALRAMELLGLLETRHGEGTFLSAYTPYQTVELLSSFILQGGTIKKDLAATKRIIEKELAKLAGRFLDTKDLDVLRSNLENTHQTAGEKHKAFFRHLSEQAGNVLLSKIWYLVDDFSSTVNAVYYEEGFYIKLLDLYKSNDIDSIEGLFNSKIMDRDDVN